jgi:hypothetical protein
MREIRTFELDQADLATKIAIARPHTLRVSRGLLWVTVEGEATDWWLSAGDRLELPGGATVWVSTDAAGGRFDLASDSGQPLLRALADRLTAGFGRRSVVRYL